MPDEDLESNQDDTEPDVHRDDDYRRRHAEPFDASEQDALPSEHDQAGSERRPERRYRSEHPDCAEQQDGDGRNCGSDDRGIVWLDQPQ